MLKSDPLRPLIQAKNDVLSAATFIGFVDALHIWVGVLVCGFRAFGLRKLRPRVELQSRMGQVEKLGYGAETKRQVGYGYDTFVMSSPPARNGETAALQVERANSADEASTGRRR